MATYAIGDIQGCFTAFQRLLDKIEFQPTRDELWLVGDLVNRGAGSLETLRWIYRHRRSIKAVLGNHDIHLLAAAAGIRAPDPRDTIDEILEAPDRVELLDYVRRLPFVVHEKGFLMVHAGIYPAWTVEEACAYSAELSAQLSSDNWQDRLQHIYDQRSRRWEDALPPAERSGVLMQVFTRMRALKENGDFLKGFKDTPSAIPSGSYAWWRHPRFVFPPDTTLICGHWAAQDLVMTEQLLAIDTGCVWGRELSAVRLPDRILLQVDATDE